MKVLHVFKTYYPDTRGGTEEFISQLVKATKHFGIDNTVFTLSSGGDGYVEYNSQQIYQAPLTAISFTMPWSFRGMFDLLRLSRECDLIHFHHPWPFADLVYIFGKIRTPAIVTYHLDLVRSPWVVGLYRLLMKPFFRQLRRIVVTSDAYLNSTQELAEFRDKTAVVPIGLDEASYPRPSQDLMDMWRQKLNFEFVVFVGAFRYYKGIDNLIRAAQQTQAHVVLIGGGPLFTEMQKLVDSLGLIDKVHLLGSLSDVDKMAILDLAKALVLPSNSRAEAFGIALLEGMMASKPLISTEIQTGTSWVNVDGMTGRVIQPDDAKQLAAAINEIVLNPDLAHQMGVQGRQRFEKLFTVDRMALAYHDIYRDVIERVSQ